MGWWERLLGWRCYHCGKHFRTKAGAEEHFGPAPWSTPACDVTVGKLEAFRAFEAKWGPRFGAEMDWLRYLVDGLQRHGGIVDLIDKDTGEHLLRVPPRGGK